MAGESGPQEGSTAGVNLKDDVYLRNTGGFSDPRAAMDIAADGEGQASEVTSTHADTSIKEYNVERPRSKECCSSPSNTVSSSISNTRTTISSGSDKGSSNCAQVVSRDSEADVVAGISLGETAKTAGVVG